MRLKKKLRWTEKRDQMKQSVITFEQFSQALLKKELAKQPESPDEDDNGPPTVNIA